jgi:hypothetical protein
MTNVTLVILWYLSDYIEQETPSSTYEGNMETPRLLVSKRTIPTERQPHVGEIAVNF